MMALPLFFSVIALVVVSTTALIIVRNRVRIRNVSESSRRNKYQSEVRSARQNATISALVNEINANTDDVNDFAKQTDGRLTKLSKTTKTRVDNIDKRLNSYHNLTTANFMGMNNRVDTEVARLDAVDDILRDKIAQERRERIAEDTKLDGLITQNRINHTTFVNSNYIPFVKQTGINFDDAYSNMNRIETEYKASDDALTSTIRRNRTELDSTINTVNSNLGARIASLQSNLEDKIFDSIEADSNELSILKDSINQRSLRINHSLNHFFTDSNNITFSPNYDTLTTFDIWAKDKYYTSLLTGNASRTFQNLQQTIDAVEDHSRQLTLNGRRLVDLDVYNQTNTSNILALQERDSLLQESINTQTDDLRSNLLNKEDRINTMDSNLKSKADAGAVSSLNASFNDLRTYTIDSLGTLETQANSNLPTQIGSLTQRVGSNETNLFKMGLVLEEHGTRISALEASGGSNSNSNSNSLPITLTPSYSSNWNPAWAPNVQAISTRVLESNYSNQRGWLMNDTDFTGHIHDTAANHSNIAKLDQLDTIFNNRILPTVKANRFEGSNATITNIETSNISINGTLDATEITTSGDVTIGGDLIIRSSNEESVTSSFSGLRSNIQKVEGMATTVSSKFDRVFDINVASPSAFAVWSPSIDTENISSIDINTNVNIGSADNPKNLKMYQNVEGQGGYIDVPGFNKIRRVYQNAAGVNQYVNLEEELNAAASGATSAQLAAQLSNQRIIDLKTGTCDSDRTLPGCFTIARRLNSLESNVSRIDSAIGSSPSPGGSISLGYPPDPNFDSITVTGNANINLDASIGRNASILGDASINGDAIIHGDATIHTDATINGSLTVDSSPNANMMMSSTGLELGASTPLKIGGTNVGTTLSDLGNRVRTLETTTNHPDKYVTDISVSGSNLQVTYDGSDAPSPNPTTVTLPSSTPPIDLTNWKIHSIGTNSATSDSIANTKLTLRKPSESDTDLYIPDKIVTDISYDDANKELNFSYQQNSLRGVQTIPLSNLEPPQNTNFADGIKIGGIIVQKDPSSNGNRLQICRGGDVGTATDCTPLWDHDQAPDPSSVSSPVAAA
jgi:hypothetical protein